MAASRHAEFLGDMPPLNAAHRRMPDRRQVSLRWLSGAVLAGLVSVYLMGTALFAALDGREKLTIPAQAYRDEGGDDIGGALMGSRPGQNLSIDTSNSRVMMVSTISREGDRDLVKVRPFLHVSSPLALSAKAEFKYPAFNALDVFAETDADEPVSRNSDLIYGAQVESEVAIKQVDFAPLMGEVAIEARQRAGDIEELVRSTAPGLEAGATAAASLAYFDPGRFSLQDSGLLVPAGVTITDENVSVRAKLNPLEYVGTRYEERVARVRSEAGIALILTAEGVDEAEAGILEDVLASDLGSDQLKPEDRLRISFERRPEDDPAGAARAMRVSVYRGGGHLVSIARTDDDRFVYAVEPNPIPQIGGSETSPVIQAGGRLPSAYDAIYRAALTEGIGAKLAGNLVRIFAFDVDFETAVTPADEIDVFLSLDDGATKPDADSEILYASIRLGSVTRKYYRFRDPETGTVDYYDETGKSAKKFLLRQPVPNGRFRSPFGSRWHPILKYRKMHLGVDWAAPRGTPILAAGNGTVESAGWQSGYGRQTIIRHANGYKTSYSHQNTIASGIVPGARVRQGQVIGYVGSTGLSTGPHLHYEVIVNGTKVDPMRIRLPKGKVLEGEQLVAFQSERDRIDQLLEGDDDNTRLAQQF